MDLKTINKYNKIRTDYLEDDENLKWEISFHRMDYYGEYTKKARFMMGKFEFSVVYYPRKSTIMIRCAYYNSSERMVTISNIETHGTTNDVIYDAIKEWKRDYLLEVENILAFN